MAEQRIDDAPQADDCGVRYEVSEHIATITIDREAQRNTIYGPMLEEIAAKMIEADQDEDVRCIILTAHGRFFCAGLDLQTGQVGGGSSDSPKTYRNLDLRTTPPTVMHNVDTPTICAMNGSAAGYGMDMALGCDIRIMAQDAKLAAAFTARGIVPESGGTWILPRLIGWSKAAELIFTGRTLNATEALEMGLVSHVVPADEVHARARALAREIAANAPLAVQASKRMMRMGLSEDFDEHVHHVFLQLLPLFRTEDFREGIAAFMEKRKADFKGN